MHVLHLDTGREMRGGQRQVLALMEALGEGNTLLTPGEGPLMQAARQKGIRVEPISPLAITNAARRSDLIHAHDARAHTWAAALSPVPLVVSRRVAFPVRNSVLSRWKYSRPRRYIAVSEFVRRTLIEAEVPEDRITVVYDGVAVLPARSNGEKTILALQSADPMKGSDLVQAARDLSGLPIEFSPDLERDLPRAAVFVYITRSEGLGSAALLAMAHGVPVVASRVGGLPEIVVDGQTGILTANEPEAIAHAISLALKRREELGRAARRCVEEQFSLPRMVDGTRTVYAQVLG